MPRVIKDIEDHFERPDARVERFMRMEEIREKERRRKRRIKFFVGVAAIACALYAVYLQF